VAEVLQRSREYAIRETPLADIAEPGADRRGAAKTGSSAARINRKRVAVRALWRIDTVATSGDEARFSIQRLQAHAATSGS
jgi:hypothetical protein